MDLYQIAAGIAVSAALGVTAMQYTGDFTETAHVANVMEASKTVENAFETVSLEMQAGNRASFPSTEDEFNAIAHFPEKFGSGVEEIGTTWGWKYTASQFDTDGDGEPDSDAYIWVDETAVSGFGTYGDVKIGYSKDGSSFTDQSGSGIDAPVGELTSYNATDAQEDCEATVNGASQAGVWTGSACTWSNGGVSTVVGSIPAGMTTENGWELVPTGGENSNGWTQP